MKGFKCSEATRLKISEAHKGKHLSAETKEKISRSEKGKLISAEIRQKMSETHKRLGTRPPNRRGCSPWNKGLQNWRPPLLYSEETKRKISEKLKGHPAANKGKPMSQEQKIKMAEATRKVGVFKKKWAQFGDEWARKLARARTNKPSLPEKIFITLIEKYSLPFKYVGNGEVILGRANPDFININGKKQLIEIFGEYYHPVLDIARKIEHYRQYGFNCLVLWESELNNEEKAIRKVKAFIKKEKC